MNAWENSPDYVDIPKSAWDNSTYFSASKSRKNDNQILKVTKGQKWGKWFVKIHGKSSVFGVYFCENEEAQLDIFHFNDGLVKLASYYKQRVDAGWKPPKGSTLFDLLA